MFYLSILKSDRIENKDVFWEPSHHNNQSPRRRSQLQQPASNPLPTQSEAIDLDNQVDIFNE